MNNKELVFDNSLIDNIQDTVGNMLLEVYKLQDRLDEFNITDVKKLERAISAMRELNYALGLIKLIEL